MKQIGAAAFKARCLRLMDEVNDRREPLLVTKKGRPVVQIVPAGEPAHDVFGCLAGRLEIVGDLLAPVADPSEWTVLS